MPSIDPKEFYDAAQRLSKSPLEHPQISGEHSAASFPSHFLTNALARIRPHLGFLGIFSLLAPLLFSIGYLARQPSRPVPEHEVAKGEAAWLASPSAVGAPLSFQRAQASLADKNRENVNERRLQASIDHLSRRVQRMEQLIADQTPIGAVPLRPEPTAGYTLLSVEKSVAYLDTPKGRVEARVGDALPQLGKIRSIEQRGGRWMLFAAAGILAAQTTVGE